MKNLGHSQKISLDIFILASSIVQLITLFDSQENNSSNKMLKFRNFGNFHRKALLTERNLMLGGCRGPMNKLACFKLKRGKNLKDKTT